MRRAICCILPPVAFAKRRDSKPMLVFVLLFSALVSAGQEPEGQSRRPQPSPAPQTTPAPQSTASPTASPSPSPRRTPDQSTPLVEEPLVVTHHEIKVGGKSLRYTATVGMMPIKNRDGETEARMFFMAYTLDSVTNRNQRPMTFAFNGGPGSA